jgi:methyl-accepting chemotaxis protein
MRAIFDQLPSFLDLGAWTAHLILPLFYFFRDENVAPALALLIFAGALGLCVSFVVDSTYIRMQVRRRTRVVQRIKDKTSFAKAMPEIQRAMLSSGYLRHSWQTFRETLIEPSDDDPPGSQVVRNTARPQLYFNTGEAGLRFPLFRAFPNLLVGIGLLLTFFGLVTALFFTTDAIKHATDLKASQDALQNLLYAASFKFYTSIAGLGGSIILTLVLRYGTSKVESSFDALASALEGKLIFVTPESIAFAHYREAKEQTRNLRLFNTEVAISVGKRVEEALVATLPNHLTQAMAPMIRSLEDVARNLTEMNEGAIGKLADNFVSKLEGATGEHMRSLSVTLGELRDSLGGINQRLDESGTGLANNVTKSSQEMREAVIAMTTTANSMRDAGVPLAESSRLIAEASGHIVQATRSVEQSVADAKVDFREVGEVLRTTLEATARHWEDYEKRFRDVDESLSSVLDRIIQSVQENLEALRGFMEKIDVKLSGAVDKLGGGIDELTEFAQQMEQVTARLNGGAGAPGAR